MKTCAESQGIIVMKDDDSKVNPELNDEAESVRSEIIDQTGFGDDNNNYKFGSDTGMEI